MASMTLALSLALLSAVAYGSFPPPEHFYKCHLDNMPERPTIKCADLTSHNVHQLLHSTPIWRHDNATTVDVAIMQEFIEAIELTGAYFAIPGNAFEGYPSLRSIKVVKNTDGDRIKIHHNALRNLPNIWHVALDNVEIVDADDINEFLTPLKDKVRILKFDRTPIETFPEILKEFTQLREIRLHDCNLTSVPDKAFTKSAASLEKVWLNHNKIKVVKKATFDGLSKVKLLALHRNQIDKIEPDTFSDLVSLQAVNVACNKLQNLSPQVFGAQPNIFDLNVYGNPMEDVTKESWNLRKLVIYASPRQQNYTGFPCDSHE